MPKNSDPSSSRGFRHRFSVVWGKTKRSISPRPPEPSSQMTTVDEEAPAVGGYPPSWKPRDSSPATLRAEPTSFDPNDVSCVGHGLLSGPTVGFQGVQTAVTNDGHTLPNDPSAGFQVDQPAATSDEPTVPEYPLTPDIRISEGNSPLVATAQGGPSVHSREPVIPSIAVSQENSSPTATQPSFDSRVSDSHIGGITPPTCWEKALGELTDKQRQVLEAFGIEYSKPLEAEIENLQSLKDCCTSNLTPGKTDKKSVMTRVRIHNILKKMEKYAIIGDIALQHNPHIVALVWAGVRFCLQVALNDMQTFEAVSSALDDIASTMGSCRIYEKIYSNELESAKAVIGQLPRLYAHCLRFMAEAIDYYQTKTSKRVAKGVTNPFETRFKPLIDEIDNGKGELERRCAVASHELQEIMSETQREQFGKLNDQLVQFRLDIARVSTGVDGLLAHVSGEKRRHILNWLSEVNFGAHHEKARHLRFDGTGEWLFGKRAFENWIETECSSVMWLAGKAGSGKTILSSLLIDTLTVTYKLVPTIYFYCNYGESERQQTLSIIGSLLKQLSTTRRSEDLDPKMVSIFDDGICLNGESSEDLFATALSRFEKVFVVVDALDECSEEERRSLVMLFTRQLKFNARCDLSKMLEGNPCHQIDANDTSKDITPFVAAELNKHIINRALLDGNVSSTLRKELIHTISVQADGMFLWAKLQLDYICKQGNEEEVRTQLTKLPRGLDSTYDRIWARINDAGDTERKWALKTLKWVLRAKAPLKPAEILEATALEPFDSTFDQKRLASSLEYLIQVCGHFIALDVQTDRLRFVHYSVQEYLGKKKEFHSAGDFVAEVCLTALGNEELGERDSGIGRHLYEYAVLHWASHCKPWETIDERRGNLVRQFLLNKLCFENSKRGQRLPESIYEVASHFNLPVVLQHLQQLGLYDDGFAPSQSLAFTIAAGRGYTAVVKVLLKGGVDANASALVPPDRYRHTTTYGYGAQYENFQVALDVAAAGGHEKVIELLLNAGADANAINGSALRVSVERGFEKVTELLLNAGADVNANGGSALLKAITGGHVGVVELLLNAGADVNAHNGSALREVARRGHEKIVRLLLNAGADVNANDRYALRVASRRGHVSVFELLLKASTDVNAEDASAPEK